jgi:hypothetical protein
VSAPKDAQVLVALQDLDQMIKEAEDATDRQKFEDMGFPVTGVEKLREARSKLEEKLPRALLVRYERLSHRMGRAVVPVVDATCTGCFSNVPAVFVSSVNRDKVIQCETCGRILFWP